MKILETEWMTYRNAVIPMDAHAIQLQESRRAFYAGAWALYSLMLTQMDEDHEPTVADMKLMEALDAEMREFRDRVAKGYA